jgi:hypothetical protein
VLGLLRPGGRLSFATDFLAYGELVMEILEGYPGLRMERREKVWDEGPRTHYERKYVEEGRPILRAEGVLQREKPRAALHPAGEKALLAATFHEAKDGDEGEPHAA